MLPLSPNIATDLEEIRRRLLVILAALSHSEGGVAVGEEEEGSSSDVEKESLRYSLWSAVQPLEPVLREYHEPVGLNLNQNDNATRQILYDFVVWVYFTPHALEDSGDISVPAYTPEESQLRVFFEHGRWFVTWFRLETDSSRPEAERWELLVFDKDGNDLCLTDV